MDMSVGKIWQNMHSKIILHSGKPTLNILASGLIHKHINLYYDVHPKNASQQLAAMQMALELEQDFSMLLLGDLSENDLDMFALKEQPLRLSYHNTW